MAERCAACGKAFSAQSKPRWAFTCGGRPAGRVHAAPCVPARDRHFLVASGQTREQAQFNAWRTYLYQRPERDTPAWDAFMLAEAPSEVLSTRQEQLLDWWARRPSDPQLPERIMAIRRAHTALIREYRVWLASLDGVPDGCALALGTEAVS